MLRLAADENFNNDIIRGVRRRNPEADIVRIQDTEIVGADDPTVLAWCAQERRTLLTHDVATMTRYAYDRINTGQLMPGIFEVGRKVSLGIAIDEIMLLMELSLDGEWEGQVRYLPLQ